MDRPPMNIVKLLQILWGGLVVVFIAVSFIPCAILVWPWCRDQGPGMVYAWFPHVRDPKGWGWLKVYWLRPLYFKVVPLGREDSYREYSPTPFHTTDDEP